MCQRTTFIARRAANQGLAARRLRRRLIELAVLYEDDPCNQVYIDAVDHIMSVVDLRYGWGELLAIITSCERILGHPYHPLPEWVLERIID